MTPEESDATPASDWEEGYRDEIVGGVLVATPIPPEAEADPSGELEYLLRRRYKDEQPQGSALDGTMAGRTIRTANRRRADRVLWAGLGRTPDPRADVPKIVVEFVSGRERDHAEKRREYPKAGAREDWGIDRFRRVMTVFRPGAEDLVVPAEGVDRTDLLPGFELPPARLIAVADRRAGDADADPPD
jgi:Uma2 family endonuclease